MLMSMNYSLAPSTATPSKRIVLHLRFFRRWRRASRVYEKMFRKSCGKLQRISTYWFVKTGRSRRWAS